MKGTDVIQHQIF